MASATAAGNTGWLLYSCQAPADFAMDPFTDSTDSLGPSPDRDTSSCCLRDVDLA